MASPKPPLTRILVTRHGQTVTNVEERFCGHFETDLTTMGRLQAESLARRLAEIPLAAVYASDLSRAIETARIATAGHGLDVQLDRGLRELHYGEWEGLKGTTVARKPAWRGQHQLMKSRDPGWCPPGGESVAAVRQRVSHALDRIIRRHRRQTVLVVTHGTAINCMLGEVLRTPIEATFSFEVTNCSLSEIVVDGSKPPVVASLNDRAHLIGIESPREK
jgi:broad specificity phosphatase PhoE